MTTLPNESQITKLRQHLQLVSDKMIHLIAQISTIINVVFSGLKPRRTRSSESLNAINSGLQSCIRTSSRKKKKRNLRVGVELQLCFSFSVAVWFFFETNSGTPFDVVSWGRKHEVQCPCQPWGSQMDICLSKSEKKKRNPQKFEFVCKVSGFAASVVLRRKDWSCEMVVMSWYVLVPWHNYYPFDCECKLGISTWWKKQWLGGVFHHVHSVLIICSMG